MAKVFILGAGTPTPTPHRWGSAFAVEVGGETLMVDCGPAATFKLAHLAQHGPMEKGIGDVRRIHEGEVVFADELMTIQL
jgi:ribonuclease BN (tRNA processing enzyme)